MKTINKKNSDRQEIMYAIRRAGFKVAKDCNEKDFKYVLVPMNSRLIHGEKLVK